MSKATDYLVEQIREKDRIIGSLMGMQVPDKARAFDEGWRAHYLEFERQKADPNHPITDTNPYRGKA